MKSIIAFLLGITSTTLVLGSGWDYDDGNGADWPHHYAMCGAADESPINIQTDNVVYDSSVCGTTFNWTIDWTIHDFKIINNGHTVVLQPVVEIDYDDDGDIDSTFIAEDGTQYSTLGLNENTIARLPNYFLPEGSPHTEFCFHSLHFHWGMKNINGSEHMLDDSYFPMEVHFVHYSCEHASLGTTLANYPDEDAVSEGIANGDDTHTLAVVGIFFELTDYDNPLFDAILSEDTLENIQYPSDVTGVAAEEIVSGVYLQDIIPDEVFTDGYFSYEGSLTTPPCTNIVRWHVMNAKSYIGKAQIARFRELMYTSNHSMAPNFRAPQNNINNVYACFEEYIEPDIETAAEKTEKVIIWVYAVFILGAMIGMGIFCVRRSKQDSKLLSDEAEDHTAKRQRLTSRSSIGQDHRTDFSRQSTDNGGSQLRRTSSVGGGSMRRQSSFGGSGHGSGHGSTGGGHH